MMLAHHTGFAVFHCHAWCEGPGHGFSVDDHALSKQTVDALMVEMGQSAVPEYCRSIFGLSADSITVQLRGTMSTLPVAIGGDEAPQTGCSLECSTDEFAAQSDCAATLVEGHV